ncbi:transcriptional regulator [Methanotrichaceae archaeon M04Ac]|uniref:Putative HTH-type transcriptional regulatory protein P0O24_01845 n=1 Tax=Candidatus Methanocrinis alkalitolerans TaxID=3033395 RepID=A0ABT5XCF3_9EURY|nr:transcriptional regulator [Candidatus Methanocrinis alkalitolerans]MCR3882812.1 transcriptional regulator [Methanothrix sp.]MDF0592326.1 transcriptional regulator [Candidatus Methanocrinis alkalitolerans]
MNKEFLTDRVAGLLSRSGFSVSDRCYVRPRSFDLAASRGGLLLILKILSNIDGLNEKTAVEIRSLAKYLSANPLLIGEKTRDHNLEGGVVYFRYGVPTVSLNTLADWIIEDIPPFVYAAHGGLYVKIDGRLLRKLRLESGISLGALASELSVSRRTISKYEIESMDTSIDVALRLEELFGQELIKPVEILEPKSPLLGVRGLIDDKVLSHLAQIGFDVFPTVQSPFNAITQNEALVVLTGVGKLSPTMMKKAKLMSSLSIITKTRSVVIVDGETKVERVEETAVIEARELETIDKTSEFADLMSEKQDR